MGNAPSPRETDRPPEVSAPFVLRDRLRQLLHVAKGHQRAVVLTHDNPDPDAVASACGLAHLLTHSAGVVATPAYGGIIGRAENKAMLKVLHLPIQPSPGSSTSRTTSSAWWTRSRRSELLARLQRAAAAGDRSPPARPASLMAAFHDVGGPAGATSTMVTQYLRAPKLVPGPQLATALFYGIKSDTRDLGREYDPADIDCYNWLFPLVDKPALSRIEHPSVPARYFAAYHQAYERARLYGGGEAVLVDLGEVYVPEIVPR